MLTRLRGLVATPRLVRSLAILPQSPRFNEADRRREGELRKVYEQSARAIRRVELDRLTSPQYKASEEQYAVLEKFDSRRELNSPKDVAGAFYTFGRMARVPPGSQLTMPPQEQQRMEPPNRNRNRKPSPNPNPNPNRRRSSSGWRCCRRT